MYNYSCRETEMDTGISRSTHTHTFIYDFFIILHNFKRGRLRPI